MNYVGDDEETALVSGIKLQGLQTSVIVLISPASRDKLHISIQGKLQVPEAACRMCQVNTTPGDYRTGQTRTEEEGETEQAQLISNGLLLGKKKTPLDYLGLSSISVCLRELACSLTKISSVTKILQDFFY